MTLDIPGVEIWINYHQITLNVQSVEWTLPANTIGQAWIWDTGIDPINPVYYSGVQAGPVSDSENVPGSYAMIETAEGIDLPTNIIHRFNIETTGGI
jgi:hypothetical protein